MQTMKVMPWGEDQGDFVLINAGDFRNGIHVEYVEASAAPQPAAQADVQEGIPHDWKTLQWKKRVALAKALGWVDGEPTADQADAWISDVIEHRRREEPQEALGGLSIREAHDKLTKAGLEWEAGATVEDLAALLATVA